MLDCGEGKGSARLMMTVVLRGYYLLMSIFGKEVSGVGRLMLMRACVWLSRRRVEIMMSVSPHFGELLLVMFLIFLVAIVRHSFVGNERLYVAFGFVEARFTLVVAHNLNFITIINREEGASRKYS